MKKYLRRLKISEIKKSIINILLINDRLDEIEAMKQKLSKVEFLLGGHLNGIKYWLKDEIGFNSQIERKKTFNEILALFEFDCILETGTNLGATTGYLAATTGRPVYSCEVSPHSYSMAKEILSPHFENIFLFHQDSIDFLKSSLPDLNKKRLFIYLDAHWYDYLPLRDEIKIIAEQCDQFLILVDDFKVEDDPGYGYDKYTNKELNLNYISDLIATYQLVTYLPTTPSILETGAKRGYVYLAKGTEIEKAMTNMKLVKVA